MSRLWKGGTGRVPVPLGTGRVPVPCITGTWYRHATCTRPVPLRQGKIKRDLSHVRGTGHIPTLEACPCPGDRRAYPSPTCPNLSHKVGLQGRENLSRKPCTCSLDQFYLVQPIAFRVSFLHSLISFDNLVL